MRTMVGGAMSKTQQRSKVVPMVSMMHPVSETPVMRMNDGAMSIASLNPDLNQDGIVEPWEKEVYQKLLSSDTDGSGTISVKELFGVFRDTSEELREARKLGGIPISDLNPDTNGDGHVEAWENDVFLRIEAADEDKSGSISVKELYSVIRRAAESDRQKRLFRSLFLAAGTLLMLMLLANAALTAAVVFLAKDTTVRDDGALTSHATGAVVRVECINGP